MQQSKLLNPLQFSEIISVVEAMALDIYPNNEEQFSRPYSSCSILWVPEAKHGAYYLGNLRTLSVNLTELARHLRI